MNTVTERVKIHRDGEYTKNYDWSGSLERLKCHYDHQRDTSVGLPSPTIRLANFHRYNILRMPSCIMMQNRVNGLCLPTYSVVSWSS